MSGDLGWYAYGIVGAGADLALDGVAGVDPQFGVETVASGDLAAVASRVRLDEFGPEALERNLEDRAWLERLARAHDAVVTRALASGAVVPLRLCTIFSSEERLVSKLRDDETRLLDELGRVQGRAEWAVKILADPAIAEAAVAAGAGSGAQGAQSAGEAAAPGRAYLARKRQERTVQEDVDAQIDGIVREAHERLQRHARASAVLRPQNSELSRRRGRMVHNGAYLVDVATADEFAAEADRLAAAHRPRGIVLEVTGPWAPYNFVTTGGGEP